MCVHVVAAAAFCAERRGRGSGVTKNLTFWVMENKSKRRKVTSGCGTRDEQRRKQIVDKTTDIG